jgi:hypothetical protein
MLLQPVSLANQKTLEMQVLQIRKSQARIVSTTCVGF